MNTFSDASAELGALGSLIEKAGAGWNELTADLFATDDGIKLREAVSGLVADGSPVTVETASRCCSAEIVGLALQEIGAGPAYWIPVLRQKRALRIVHSAAQNLLAQAQKLNSEKRSVAEDLRQAIGTATVDLLAASGGLDDGRRLSMNECLAEVLEGLEAANRGELPPTIPTGLSRLDRALGGGLPYRALTVLGARTSVGKSALALSIAKAACTAGKSVLYLSREMPYKEITARLWSAESGVPIRICDGTKLYSEQDRKMVHEAQARIKGWRLTIRDDLRSIGEVRAEAATLKSDLVVIDHLGIFDSGLGPKSSSYDKATANSHAARDLAFDSNCAVLGLVQVNRDGADEPQLSNLKGSGSFEEDARVVLLLHRVEEITKQKQHLSLNLAKNTYGPLDFLNLQFNAARCNFAEEYDIAPAL